MKLPWDNRKSKYSIRVTDSVFIPQADENLRLIRSSLPDAVETCIDAAGYEFDVSRQRTLLRAASYGQAFCRLVVHWHLRSSDSVFLRVWLGLWKKCAQFQCQYCLGIMHQKKGVFVDWVSVFSSLCYNLIKKKIIVFGLLILHIFLPKINCQGVR